MIEMTAHSHSHHNSHMKTWIISVIGPSRISKRFLRLLTIIPQRSTLIQQKKVGKVGSASLNIEIGTNWEYWTCASKHLDSKLCLWITHYHQYKNEFFFSCVTSSLLELLLSYEYDDYSGKINYCSESWRQVIEQWGMYEINTT